MISRFKQATLALIPVALTFAAISAAPVQADPFHKHPMASAIGAGMLAHHMAKHSSGHGMMHRHPMMTGMAAAMGAHHMLKKH